jgi:hypothetical protein
VEKEVAYLVRHSSLEGQEIQCQSSSLPGLFVACRTVLWCERHALAKLGANREVLKGVTLCSSPIVCNVERRRGRVFEVLLEIRGVGKHHVIVK